MTLGVRSVRIAPKAAICYVAIHVSVSFTCVACALSMSPMAAGSAHYVGPYSAGRTQANTAAPKTTVGKSSARNVETVAT